MRDLKRGEHFGELALLNPMGAGKRSLSVRVKSDRCVLVFFNRTDFQKIVGNISKYLKMNYGGEFDKQFQYQQQQAAGSGQRRGSVTQMVSRPRIIPGVDATIIEVKEESVPSSRSPLLSSEPYPSSSSV